MNALMRISTPQNGHTKGKDFIDAGEQHRPRVAGSAARGRFGSGAVPARTGLGALVEQALGIEFAQPVQGKRRAGAVAQQPLTSGTVSGLDAHRRINGKAPTEVPSRHCPRVIGRQRTAPYGEVRRTGRGAGVP